MKKLLLAGFLTVLSLYGVSQATVIDGVVTDAVSKKPIGKVKVSIDADHYTYTNLNGAFKLGFNKEDFTQDQNHYVIFENKAYITFAIMLPKSDTSISIQMNSAKGGDLQTTGASVQTPNGVQQNSQASVASVGIAAGMDPITLAIWANNTGSAMNTFTATWVVPPLPTSDKMNVIINFAQDASGYSTLMPWLGRKFGGWTIASIYYTGSYKSPAVQQESGTAIVPPGTRLTSVITCTGRTGNNYNYTCYFQGLPNTSITVSNVPELRYFEMGLCLPWGLPAQCATDYPPTISTLFSGITLTTANGNNPALNWTVQNVVTGCGEHTIPLSNSNPDGQVALYYRTFPASGTYYNILPAANTNLALDVTGCGSQGTPLQLWTRTVNNGCQRFNFISVGGGYFNINFPWMTGTSIDDNGNFNYYQTLKTQYRSLGSANQKFNVVPLVNGYYRLESYNPAFSIDNSGNVVQGAQPWLWASDNTNVNQQWVITPAQ